MRAPPAAACTPGTRVRRNAAVVVAESCITVVESAELADSSALDDALSLLVTWAIRACTPDPEQQRPTEPAPGRHVASADAATPKTVAAYGLED